MFLFLLKKKDKNCELEETLNTTDAVILKKTIEAIL